MSESRIEAILAAKSANVPYTGEPLSRLEEELLNTKFSEPPKVVNSFSEMTEEGVTYAILNTDEGEYNSYTEYTLINGKPERYGKQDIVVDAYTRAETDSLLAPKANTSYVDNELSQKVDKVNGKGLSTEDYTSAEKEKLSGVEAGAQVNPDLAKVASTGSYNDLSDKPVIPESQSKMDRQITIAASGWSNGIYSFENLYPSSTYDILDITPIDGVTTDAQKEAWNKANCNGYNATNIIKVKGTVPTIDIVVMLLLIKKG